ncbi:hypothetical protein E2C01_062297 [Portunus trituberculatus]|uniref:Uncharacterized protein n=1 Tax=Portunus trituberculatus TaxID=210409 RepID=A0A5B7HHM9_PORTR|nr:hypothetical protein [Portunus trituberculatus]
MLLPKARRTSYPWPWMAAPSPLPTADSACRRWAAMTAVAAGGSEGVQGQGSPGEARESWRHLDESMKGRRRAAAAWHRTSPEAHRMSISVTSKTRGRQGNVTELYEISDAAAGSARRPRGV